jgi:FkbM family methyltransferase
MQTPIGELIVRDSYDEAVIREVVFDRSYERWGEIELVGTVLDLGAHIGSFSALAIHCGCSVTAVEPSYSSFKLLEQNAPKAIKIHKAVGRGRVRIAQYERSELNKIANEGEEVDTITLDELITGPIDLLKIDIEGAEYEALYSSSRLSFVRQITMEYHDGIGRLGELLTFLDNNGFRFGWIGGQDFGHLQVKRRA